MLPQQSWIGISGLEGQLIYGLHHAAEPGRFILSRLWWNAKALDWPSRRHRTEHTILTVVSFPGDSGRITDCSAIADLSLENENHLHEYEPNHGDQQEAWISCKEFPPYLEGYGFWPAKFIVTDTESNL